MSVDLATFNNDWYQPGGRIKRALWYILNAFFLKTAFPFSGVKVFLLRTFGASIGKNVVLKPNINIKYPWLLTIGDNAWIGEKVWIDNLGKVYIGNNVCVSQGALLLCGNHDYKKTSFDLMVGDITLHEGVWIGAKCIVTGGVVCQSHAVLTAGSVASKNLEPFKIYQGNPAVFVRDRNME
jgi:putative colanic acid biosynthesis acetyltransferase WcaF